MNPGLVMVSISAFGQEGPYSQYLASDLTGVAWGGSCTLRVTMTGSYSHWLSTVLSSGGSRRSDGGNAGSQPPSGYWSGAAR